MQTFKINIPFYLLLSLMTMVNLNAQVKKGISEINKSVKKGVYGGTFSLSNGNKAIFFQQEGELAAYEFDGNAQFVKTHLSSEANNLLTQVDYQENTIEKGVNPMEISEDQGINIMYAKESWGSLKLVDGLLYLSSTDKFINGFELDDKDTRKLKIEGTWRTANIGARAILPKDKTLYKFKARNGRYVSYDFTKAHNVIHKYGFLQSAGIITEKISISNPSPHNANRLVVFKIGFDNDETSNIHIMPYSMRGIGAGSDAQGNMTVMTVPLNAPSTYGPHRKLNAKDEDRSYLYLYRFDNDNNLIDEQKIKSDLNNVNSYQTMVAENKTYLIGTGKVDGKGFISSYPGQKTNAVSIAVLNEEGKLSPFKTYSEDVLEGKMEMNGGKSNMKFDWGPYFHSVSTLENGNIFLMGKSAGFHHGVLLSANGELIKYHLFPHLDPTKNISYTEQIQVKDNKIYVILADQPHNLANTKRSSVSTSGNVTSTTTSQLFEIFHLSNLYKIDGNTGSTKKTELNKEIKDFYTLGNTPAIFGDEGIFIPGRIKANKGKEVALMKIDY